MEIKEFKNKKFADLDYLAFLYLDLLSFKLHIEFLSILDIHNL